MKSIFTSILLIIATSVFAQGIKEIQAPGNFEFSTSYNFENETKLIISYPGSGIPDRVTRYFYNEMGQQTSSEYDYNADNDFDFYTDFTYNEKGLLIKAAYRLGELGTPDLVITYSYNDSDSLIFQKDSSSSISTKTITYNSLGLKTKEIYDGTTYSILTTWRYDDNSRVVIKESGPTGQPATSFNLYTYNAKGLLVKEREARETVGNINRVYDYIYDDQNRLIQTLDDHDNDGEYNTKKSVVYNTKNQVVSKETIFSEANVFQSGSTYTYDLNGNIVKRILLNKDREVSRSDIYEYANTTACDLLGDGLAHKLVINIPQEGKWRIELCGSNFQNKLALSAIGFCEKELGEAGEGCTSGDARLETNLSTGDYYLTVVGKGITDDGEYNLNIERLSSAGAVSKKINKLSVYPNPANSVLTIDTKSSEGTIALRDVTGQVVLTQQDISTSKTINVKTLNKGIYFITLTDGANTYQSKFIKR